MIPQTTLRAALADPNLLGSALGGPTWLAWRSLLLAAMGEELLPGERLCLEKLTGRDTPPAQRVRELWAITGRRAGKSTAAAVLAVYLAALCRWPTSTGERGHVLIVGVDRAQAGIILDYVRTILNASPVLRQLVECDGRKAEAIDLTTGVTIAVCAASSRALRGFTSIAVICDEIAWFEDDTEILAAARSTLATTGGPLLVVGSPRGKHGELWETYRRHYGPDGAADVLVAQGNLNPALPDDAQFRPDAVLPAPELPVVVRVAVPDLDTSKFAPSAPPKVEKPRKAKKRRAEQAVPQYFLIQTRKPSGDDPGEIEESWWIIADGLVFICDAAGVVNGEGRAIERNDPTWIARQMLRGRRMSRPGEPYRGKINYPKIYY